MKLEVKEIRKSFGDTEILHGITFEVESGVALGLLGRNGAGKTTTIRILMDVFKANEGKILLDGAAFDRKEHQIGYLPEERGLYPKKTVQEQLIYLAMLRGMKKKEAAENTKKWLKRLEVDQYLNRKLETLSKGNQQKVQLASTLVCDPEIVILDEPFSGLDPVNSQILKDVVKELIEQGKIVIFSSHQMSYVEEFCDNIVIIDHGEVALKGRLQEIKREYGRHLYILNAENYEVSELKNKCEKELADYMVVQELKKEFLVLKLKEKVGQEDFLNAILHTDIVIDVFGNYKPSLNDIFVARVGNDGTEGETK